MQTPIVVAIMEKVAESWASVNEALARWRKLIKASCPRLILVTKPSRTSMALRITRPFSAHPVRYSEDAALTVR